MSKFLSILDGADIAQTTPSPEVGFNYFQFIRSDGSWVIMREEVATGAYRYTVGSSDASTGWTARASHNYKSSDQFAKFTKI